MNLGYPFTENFSKWAQYFTERRHNIALSDCFGLKQEKDLSPSIGIIAASSLGVGRWSRYAACLVAVSLSECHSRPALIGKSSNKVDGRPLEYEFG